MGHCDISTGKGHPLLPFFVFLAVLYETNSAGIVCMFNGCNYVKCANGGTCKMREDCSALCDCPPDFTGRLCGKVNGNQSCTDTCLPGTCHQNESCSQDPTTCKINCSVTGATNGTPCYPFDCIHGVCNNSTCHCDDQWGGNSCNIFCGRNCTRGECRITVGGPGCLCPEGFTPESNCTMETEKPEPEFIEVISLSIPLIIFVVLFPLILVLAFSLIVYVMWKKRMIFVMKIVYYLQKYEDSDSSTCWYKNNTLQYSSHIQFESSSI